MTIERMTLKPDSLLIVVDMQNDFITGSLAVPGAEDILPTVNACINHARRHAAHIAYSMDFHKEDHPSFKPQGGLWPPHCVMGTSGQKLADTLDPALAYNKRTFVLKGYDDEAYSAFDKTGFGHYLKWQGVKEVYVCGLALDYCVKATAIDAKALGYPVAVVLDACAAVEERTGAAALSTFEAKRIELRATPTP
jgi:nicotinamidase/pyrazinamidase